jgi:hypothetical protein
MASSWALGNEKSVERIEVTAKRDKESGADKNTVWIVHSRKDGAAYRLVPFEHEGKTVFAIEVKPNEKDPAKKFSYIQDRGQLSQEYSKVERRYFEKA